MADTIRKVKGRAGIGELPVRRSSTIVAENRRLPQALPVFRAVSSRYALVVGWIALAAGGCRSGQRTPTATRAWEAMGAVFSVAAWGADSGRLERAVAQARDSVRLVDSLLSTQDSESELSQVNRAGAGTSLSPTLRAVLRVALDVARSSHGAFDPTRRNWRAVRFDSAGGRVTLPPRQRLDVAWIAEGYALDRALLPLAPVADSAVLSVSGQYLIMTPEVRKPSAPPASGGGRFVGVVDPSNTLEAIAMIGVPPGTWAVSTTSQAERPEALLDPRAGRAGERVRAVAVVAHRAVVAMAWSSALFVLGCDRALTVAADQGNLDVLCIDHRVRWSAGLEGRIRTTRD
jgi:thiamine biosynthesis lipoprotein